jgi:hypothetical protein
MAEFSATTQRSHRAYWYNFNTVAYDCPEKGDGHVFLRVQRFRATNTTRKIPPVSPSAEELRTSDSEIRGLWVGMWLQASPEHRAKNPTKEKGKGTKWKGSIADLKEIELLPHDPAAQRVVVNPASASTLYYALINPDETGICETRLVDKEEVFFAPEYRDSGDTEAQTEKRRTGYPTCIRDALQKINLTISSDGTRKKKPTRTIGKQESLSSAPTLASRAYELERDLIEFEMTGESKLLDSVLARLQELDGDAENLMTSSTELGNLMSNSLSLNPINALREIKVRLLLSSIQSLTFGCRQFGRT